MNAKNYKTAFHSMKKKSFLVINFFMIVKGGKNINKERENIFINN